MTRGSVSVRFSVVGMSQVRTALRGLSSTMQQAERTTRSEANTTTQQVARAREGMVRATREAQREGVAEFSRGERRIRSEAATSTREITRSARQQADAVLRERRRAGVGRGSGGSRGLAIGSAIVGGVTDAMGRVQGFAAAGGVVSPEQLAANYAAYRVRGVRLASQSGLDRGEIDSRVMGVAHRTGVDPSELMGGLETGQGRFDNARGVLRDLEQYAQIHRATGASTEDIVGASGEARRAFDLTDAETADFTNTALEAANRGSIDYPQLAGAFASAFGEMGRGTGRRGIEGARDALQVAELVGGGGMTADESATGATRFVNELSDRTVQQRLHRHGVEVLDGEGNIRPMMDIVEQMGQSDSLGRPGALGSVFRDERSRRAAGVLRTQAVDHPELLETLRGITAEGGREFLTNTTNALDGDEGDRFLRQGTDQMVTFAQSGEANRVLSIATNAGTALTRLSAQYPLATQALGVLTGAAQAAGMSLAALQIFGGAGATGAGGVIGGLARGVAGVGAVTAGAVGAFAGATGLATLYNFVNPDSVGGDTGRTDYEGVRQTEARDALTTALDAGGGRRAYADTMRGLDAPQRTEFAQRAGSSMRDGVALTPQTIAALAAGVAAAVRTPSAPTDGRTSGDMRR